MEFSRYTDEKTERLRQIASALRRTFIPDNDGLSARMDRMLAQLDDLEREQKSGRAVQNARKQ